MAMSKGKVMACVAGGLFVVTAGVLGYLLYDAYSTRVEKEEELDGERSTFRNHYQAAVFPSRKSIDAVTSNRADYVYWLKGVQAFAARGDKSFPQDETPAAFKQRLAEEIRRLSALPGGADGHLAAQGFLFGFDKYLGESAVLPEKAEVPLLAVQLDTISRLADMFAKADVLEVREIKRLEPAAEKTDGEERRPSAKKRRPAKEKEAEDGPVTTSLDYGVSILVRPSAFVRVLNALTADVRFTVVKTLSFRESADMIVDKLNAIEAALTKKDAPATGRRRRRRAAAEEEPAEETAKKEDRLVVDPELDAPVAVDMTISVYDFGRAGAAGGDGAAAAGGKESK